MDKRIRESIINFVLLRELYVARDKHFSEEVRLFADNLLNLIEIELRNYNK